MRVDSGLDEDAASNYGKIAKAVGNVIEHGINVSLIDINKSKYMFEPDIENGSILYGMKALNGVGGEIIQEIIDNRPYESLDDFLSKVKCTRTVVLSLIKSGAFDQFGEREQIMKDYIWKICEPKKRVTMQNFNMLNERNLLPDELSYEKRLFIYNKALKANCKVDDYFVLRDNYYDFYEEFFEPDLLESGENGLFISVNNWKKCYDEGMKPAKEYIKAHAADLLEKLNNSLFQEMWDKYAAGSYSTWEMSSVGFYYHPHELINIDNEKYFIHEFDDLNENPIVDYVFKRGDVSIPIFKTCRIVGTVIAKDDMKTCISILTPHSGVVTVKFNRDYYAKYNKQISEVMIDGKKKVREKGWFTKGTLVMVNGFRRGDTFVAKKYSKTPSHQLYKITLLDDNEINITNLRWDEKE